MSESAAAYSTKPDKVNFNSGNIQSEWLNFKQKFDLYIIATQQESAPPKVKFAQMIGLAGQHALDVYNSFKDKLVTKVTDDKGVETIVDKSQDYQSVLSEFDAYASEHKSLTACREFFNKRNQKQGEPFANWLTDLRNRIKHCEYKDIEDSILKDRIVLGVHDKRLQVTLRGKPNLSLQEVIDICKGVEATLKNEDVTAVHVEQIQAHHSRWIQGGRQKLKFRGRGNFNFRGRGSAGRVMKSSGRGNFRGRRPFRGRGSFRGGRNDQSDNNKEYQCRKCNRWHGPGNCPAYGQQCHKCHGYNHFATICTKVADNSSAINGPQNQNSNKAVTSLQTQEMMALTKFNENEVIISGESRQPRKEYTEVLRLGGEHYIKFKLDPGAEVNVLPMKVFQIINTNNQYQIRPTGIMLKAFGNSFSKSEGVVKFLTETKAGSKIETEFLLSSVEDRPILGLEDCERLNLIKRVIPENKIVNKISSCLLPESKDDFINMYSELFTGLGEFKQTVTIHVNPDVQPGVCPSRRYNYSICERLKPKLDDLEKAGIIAKITKEIPKFVSNLVIREKPNGDLRLCLDPEILNQAIIRQKYTIPTMEEITCKVKDKKFFTVLDLKDGFWHATLDEQSSLLCTFSTPFGLYRFKKMPFGISCAPEVFQFLNDQAFHGVPCEFYFDDCLVAGKDIEEHDMNLRQVMNRGHEENIKFNPKKLQYRLTEVKFLGHLWSLNRVRIDPERLLAINALKEPKTRKQLQKVLATFNYLRKWVPQMSTIAGPLYNLLSEKVLFQWLPIHSHAFRNLQEIVCKAPALTTFDAKKPIVVQADASQYGLGACLLQDKLPIVFASRLLNDAEKEYAQVEKEMLALCFAAFKFEKFIYGMKNVLFQTDHQPLVSVFKKPICKITNSRLKRFRLKMLKFQPVVEYLPGKHMLIADLLSRQCIEEQGEIDPEMTEEIHEVTKYLPVSDVIKSEIIMESETDTGLKAVKTYYQQGWPKSRNDVVPEAKEYWQLRNDLFVENGMVILDDRVVIPVSLRQKVLKTLHTAHLGIDKTKAKARQAVYWPGISNDIVTLISTCRICERHSSKNQREPLIPHAIPELRFQKVSADILDISGNYYLAVEDNLSKWLEIKKLPNKTCSAVIEALRSIFYTHGIPEIIYGDNNPLDYYECREFAKGINSKIETSSPEYPRSNGLAEKGVHIAKKLLTKCAEAKTNYLDALREYNNTPLTGMTVSPSQILMSRNCRTMVPITKTKLEPKIVNVRPMLQTIQDKIKKQHDLHARRKPVSFVPGDNVVVRRGKIWQKGVIERKTSAARSYYVKPLSGHSIRRNTFHLKHSATQPDNYDELDDEPYDIDSYLTKSDNVPSCSDEQINNAINIVPLSQAKVPRVVLERIEIPKRQGAELSSDIATKRGRIVKPNTKYDNPNMIKY